MIALCNSAQAADAFSFSSRRAALVDGIVLPGNRLVAVGYSQSLRDTQPQLAVSSFASAGDLAWHRTFPLSRESAGKATSAAAGPNNVIFVGGSRFQNGIAQGVALCLNEQGELLWESNQFSDAHNEVNAIGYDTSGMYVTGLIQQAASSSASPGQSVFLTKLAALTGIVLWQREILSPDDPLRITAGLSLAISPAGTVAVTGVADPIGSAGGWFVSVWDAAGNHLWRDIRRGVGGGASTRVALKGRFDEQGNLYVVGRLPAENEGANLHIIKYSPQGDELWQFTRHAGLLREEQDFDQATGLFVTADRVLVVGILSEEDASGSLIQGGIAIHLSSTREVLWEQRLFGNSLSGELINDVVLDTEGNAYYGGTGSGDNVGKDIRIEKTDQDGNLLWSVTLELSRAMLAEQDAISRLLVGENGKLFALGTVTSDGSNQEQVAVQLDALGNLHWTFPPGIRSQREARFPLTTD
jgi:hypothetical protein